MVVLDRTQSKPSHLGQDPIPINVGAIDLLAVSGLLPCVAISACDGTWNCRVSTISLDFELQSIYSCQVCNWTSLD